MELTELRNNLLFRNMDDSEITECLTALSARETSYEKNSLILLAGDTTENMGIVLDGSVTIENIDFFGNCTVLSRVGKGGFFAETYALMKDTPLLVDVRAVTDCRVLFLNLQPIRSQSPVRSSWFPKLTASLLNVSIRKNLALSERSFHTAPKTIREKVLSYLESISLKKHSAEFDIPFDRQQLADYLNVDRTALSKELGKMKADGLIDFRRSHFVLHAH